MTDAGSVPCSTTSIQKTNHSRLVFFARFNFKSMDRATLDALASILGK